jgi:hypothetical protein
MHVHPGPGASWRVTWCDQGVKHVDGVLVGVCSTPHQRPLTLVRPGDHGDHTGVGLPVAILVVA